MLLLQRYLLPLFRFITKLNGSIILCMCLAADYTYAANISLNGGFANERNQFQIIRALADEFGIDSLCNLASQSPLVFCNVTCDSLGYVKSLHALNFVVTDSSDTNCNQRTQITGNALKRVEKRMIDKGTQLTTIPDVTPELYYSPKDSIEDVISNSINVITDRYYKTDVSHVFFFRLFANWILSDEQLLSTQESIEKICNDIGTFKKSYGVMNNSYFPSDSCTVNDALFMMSMIYAFGDYKVNKWLDKYKFSIKLLLDENGLVTDASYAPDYLLPPDFNKRILSAFLKNNRIRFTPDGSERAATIDFPSGIYDVAAKTKDFYTRMVYVEEKTRAIITSGL